ncbi:MAG TPA: alpha/beta hydrolase [Microlunatus sp.]|nr:alpha/beta hydrolase [Microlunatus sp.]
MDDGIEELPHPPVRHGWVTAPDGVRLHTVSCGPQQGRPVLMIHGGGQSWLCWHKQLVLATEGLRLICYDLRGHGASGSHHDHSYRTLGRDAEAVLDHHQVAQATVVAWSLGGPSGSALLTSGRACGILYVSTAANFILPRLIAVTPPAALPAVLGMLADPRPGSRRRFLRLIAAPHVLEQDEEAIQLRAAVRADPREVRRLLRGLAFTSGPALAAVAQAKVPVTVIAGTMDRLVTHSAARYLAALAPQGRLITYQGAGHAPFLQFPERFNQDLKAVG